jgi:hypothetical protein
MKYEAHGTVAGRVARVTRERVGKDPAKQYDKTVALIETGEGKDGVPIIVAVTGFGRDAVHLEGVEAGMEVACAIRPASNESSQQPGRYYDSHAVTDCRIIDESGAAPLPAGEPTGKALDAADDPGMPF